MWARFVRDFRLDRRASVLRVGYRAGSRGSLLRGCPLPYRERCSTNQNGYGAVFRDRDAMVPVVYD